MMKFVKATLKTGAILGAGLTFENLRRLKAGQPIQFGLEDLGYALVPLKHLRELEKAADAPPLKPGAVIILTGKDEASIAADLGIEGAPNPKPGEAIYLKPPKRADPDPNQN